MEILTSPLPRVYTTMTLSDTLANIAFAMETQQQDTFKFKDLFEHERLYSLITGFLLLGISFIVDHFAAVYAFSYLTRPTTRHVGDLLLDNIPIVDLNFIIIEGVLLSITLGTLYLFSKPRYLLFTLKTLALFIVIRALSISLTHIGIYPGQINPGAGFFDAIYLYYNFQTGFFFSGHTWMTFLMALVFWEKPIPRTVFLSLSFIFAVAVLLAHIHYSIDVFAAPFMAYGIFKITCHLFPRDYELIASR